VGGAAPIQTVLLVDDEPDIRAIARLQLEAAGYTVHEAADGVEALDLLRRVAADVILLDLDMPRMDGLKFLEALRSSGGDRIPVVAFSADDGPKTIARLAELGCRDQVRKPYLARQLLGAVASARN
jgi:CheY-like chemotaxis protein